LAAKTTESVLPQTNADRMRRRRTGDYLISHLSDSLIILTLLCEQLIEIHIQIEVLLADFLLSEHANLL